MSPRLVETRRLLRGALRDRRGAGAAPLACALLALAASLVGLSCSQKSGPLGPSDIPSAAFTVSPGSGTTETEFFVDASGSSDLIDPVFKLRVRWDWEDDGSWDTALTIDKTARHRYVQPGMKSIRVEVMDSDDHASSAMRQVEVLGAFTCAATGEPLVGPEPLEVHFNAIAGGGTPPRRFAWDYGDGGGSTEQSPTHVYETQGTYLAMLTVTDSGSPQKRCRDTLEVRVSSNGESLCVASGKPTIGTPPLVVQFSGTPGGAPDRYAFRWRFDDGDSSDEQNPEHAYASPGTFDAEFTAIDTARSAAECRDTVRVIVSTDLACVAGAAPTAGVAPIEVSFSGQVAGGSPPYGIVWTFGDGGSAAVPNPKHTYASAGVYEAILTLTDAAAPPAVCRDTILVRVASRLACVAAADPTAGSRPLAVAFAAGAEGGTGPYAFRWAFGDGQESSDASPMHTYDATGAFSAILTVTDTGTPQQTCRDTLAVTVVPPLACDAAGTPGIGSAPLSVSFTASAVGGVLPFGYSWTFGDGGTSTSRTPTHVYMGDGAFVAIVTVTDSDAPRKTCRDSVGVLVTSALACAASATPSSGLAPLTVALQADAGGGAAPYAFHWTFGDGGESDSEDPSHAYVAGGTFSAILTVLDSSQPQETCRDTVMVTVTAPLTCQASANPAAGVAPLSVSFTGAASGGVAPRTFGWVFGDGATSTAQSPSHAYAAGGSYDAILTVSDAGSPAQTCRDTVRVTVASPLSCSASGTPNAGPSPLAVAFQGGAAGGAGPYAFAWTFGDGGSSSAASPAHTYQSDGDYAAVLVVTDSSTPRGTCRDTVRVVASDALVCSASAIPSAGPSPLSVAFAGTAAGGVTPHAFAWSFGDGATSAGAAPNHVYSTSGTRAAVLTVTDSDTPPAVCRDTLTIVVAPPLSCSASGNPTSGPAPLSIAFQPTVTGGSAPFAYDWRFGDGGFSFARAPSHVYALPGAYSAILTITDSGSPALACRDTVGISVVPALACGIARSPAVGIFPLSVTFSTSPSNGQPPYSFAWKFGDGGTSSAQNPAHTYANAGNYSTTLTIVDSSTPQQTCRDTIDVTALAPLTCQASQTVSAGVAPLSVGFGAAGTGGVAPYTYSWSFGDGGSSALPSPNHVFASSDTFDVVLTLKDAGSPQQTCRDTLRVRALPLLTCGATRAPSSGVAPLTVSFTSSASGGVGPYAFAWSFGDAGFSSTQNPSHPYASAGTYNAVVTITDAGAPQQTCRDTVQVTVLPVLTCGATRAPSSGVEPLTVSFTSTASGGVGPYDFAWDFGDAGSSALQNPSHDYLSAGTYDAFVTITDAGNPQQTCRDTVQVTVLPVLTCGATRAPSSGVEPLTVSFTSTASGGVGPYDFAWDFGDAGSSALQNPSHDYLSAGTYDAFVTITDAGAPQQTCRDTVQVTVLPVLTCGATRAPSSGVEPLTVSFTSTASGGVGPYDFAWDFGDAGSSALQNPSHDYLSAGTYDAFVTITDAGNPQQTCRDTVQVTVLPVLTCGATRAPSSGVEPLTVSFTSTASGGVGPYDFAWDFGDAGSSALQNPSHDYLSAGTYDAFVTITDAGAPQQTCRDTVQVTVLPIAGCSATRAPSSGVEPLTVSFTSTASGGVGPYDFAWDFGDAGSSALQNPSHDYLSAGTYDAVVTITDAGAPQQTCRDTVQVTVLPVLTCGATRAPSSGVEPLTVSFTSTASGGVGPYDFAWDFGDAGSSALQNPSHDYLSAGTYDAVVTITDAGAPQQTCRDTVQVTVLPVLTCGATRAPSSGVEPLTVSFTSTASGGVGPYDFAWDFGDAGSSALQNPSHDYLSAGTYDAVVTITDAGNPQQTCRDTVQVTVLPLLTCGASGTNTTGPAPLAVDFQSSISGGVPPYNTSWVFGDGNFSSLPNPQNSYAASGIYEAILSITDSGTPQQSCADTVSVDVTSGP